MKWNIQKSEELKLQIAKNEKLLNELSKVTHEILLKHRILLNGYSYILEPRIFSYDRRETPEIAVSARENMLKEMVEEHFRKNVYLDDDFSNHVRCIPECGIVSPKILELFEKLRIKEIKNDSPVNISDSIALIDNIVGNRLLLNELSETIFVLLSKHNIVLSENEGCVFTPFVFETPVYAQKIRKSVTDDNLRGRGFGPQVLENPNPQPALSLKPFPGIIEHADEFLIPTVILKKWWWVGIPAPEMLIALEKIRTEQF